MVNYFAIPNKEIKISDIPLSYIITPKRKSDTPLSYIITPKRKTNQHDVRMFLQSKTMIHISLSSHRIHWPPFMQNFLKYFLLNDAQKIIVDWMFWILLAKKKKKEKKKKKKKKKKECKALMVNKINKQQQQEQEPLILSRL